MRPIDADALLAQMKEYYEKLAEEANMTGDRAICVTWHDAVILIKSAPTVDAVPVRHGKWIKWFEDADGQWMRCSECQMMFYVGKGRDGNYCPNCGARMDEE